MDKTYLDEIAELVSALDKLGFAIRHYSEEPKAFDNFVVDFTNGHLTFIMVQDKS